jgi:molybdate transport system substrate-binding protein
MRKEHDTIPDNPRRSPDLDAGARAESTIYAAASLRTPSASRQHREASWARRSSSASRDRTISPGRSGVDKGDLFISADEGWMDKVAEAGLADRRRAARCSRTGWSSSRQESREGRLRRGWPNRPSRRSRWIGVRPAGKYAKAGSKKGLWSDALKARILSTADVRAALAAVASGNVDAGVVYKTDAAISPKVKVLYEVPESETPKISYPIAVMAHGAHPKESRAAAEYLEGPEARAVFERFGFIAVGAAVKH